MDVDAFERLALPALEEPVEVLVVDEVGKMEPASARFRAAVEHRGRDRPAVATVHVHRDPVTDALKKRKDARLIAVDHRNRDTLAETVAEMLGLRS